MPEARPREDMEWWRRCLGMFCRPVIFGPEWRVLVCSCGCLRATGGMRGSGGPRTRHPGAAQGAGGELWPEARPREGMGWRR